MRAVIQRVSQARVTVDDHETARMGKGLLVLLGAGQGDDPSSVDWMATKITQLRIFEDQGGKLNLSLLDVAGEMIVVSQFTLFGDCRKGRRPSFAHALEPAAASALCDQFVTRVRALGIRCGTGLFGAHMQVTLTNDGPVTLLLDSTQARRAGQGGFGNASDERTDSLI